MTAPKVIRTNLHGTALVTDFGEWETDVRYIRADAPELAALVALVRDCIEPDGEFQAQWDRDAIAALAAWEAIAAKPATVTAPGMHPEDMPLERPTPLHLGGKAGDDA